MFKIDDDDDDMTARAFKSWRIYAVQGQVADFICYWMMVAPLVMKHLQKENQACKIPTTQQIWLCLIQSNFFYYANFFPHLDFHILYTAKRTFPFANVHKPMPLLKWCYWFQQYLKIFYALPFHTLPLEKKTLHWFELSE